MALSVNDAERNVFILPASDDRARFKRFLEVLDRQGIEATIASGAFEANNVLDVWGKKVASRSFAAGTVVVRAAQPHRRLLQAVLDFDPHLSAGFLNEERTELENHRGTRVYDTTAWNLSMAYGLEAYWAHRVSDLVGEPTDAASRGDDAPRLLGEAAYGYLIDGADSGVYRAIVRLLDGEGRVRVAVKPFKAAGREYAPGAVLLRNHENPANLRQLVAEATAGLSLDVRPVDTALSAEGPDLGGNRFRLLTPPRIAIASQWPIMSTSFGAAWHLLDFRMEARTSPINLQSLSRVDLRKYNVIVIPGTWEPKSLLGVLNERARQKLEAWVKSGGTLIAIGGSAAFLAGKEHALGSVRLKRDVLDQLGAYEEAVERETRARAVCVDPDEVWGARAETSDDDGEAPDNDRAVEKPAPGPDLEALKRRDEWERIFKPMGVFAAASLDPEHWLCFGLGERLPVMLLGSHALMSMHPVRTPARLAESAELRLAGLLWPEARGRWAQTAYATVERVGDGQVILFAFDPFFRGYLEGTGRMFLNALLLGPGLGTSQPVPW